MGIIEYIVVLNEEKKMSFQEIADYVGVEKYVVNNWKKGANVPKSENFDKVREMYERLKDKDIKYRKQAIDILRGV